MSHNSRSGRNIEPRTPAKVRALAVMFMSLPSIQMPDPWNSNCSAIGRMKSQLCTLNLRAGDMPAVRVPLCPTRQRLTQAFSRLQDIQLVRNHRQDPFFGKSAEERVIWRELLDLELQDVDEHLERISAA